MEWTPTPHGVRPLARFCTAVRGCNPTINCLIQHGEAFHGRYPQERDAKPLQKGKGKRERKHTKVHNNVGSARCGQPSHSGQATAAHPAMFGRRIGDASRLHPARCSPICYLSDRPAVQNLPRVFGAPTAGGGGRGGPWSFQELPWFQGSKVPQKTTVHYAVRSESWC